MFVLVTGSVVVSCTTAPAINKDTSISLNAGRSMNGEIYTIWVFNDIQSVIIINLDDRSRKIELTREEWKYDPKTTELRILKKIPFSHYLAGVDGNVVFPHTFVLNDIEEEDALAVILDDRLAIDGYDYSFELETSRLVFRNDVNLKNIIWCISYHTPGGGSMLGEWEADDQDKIDYLMAEHRKRYLDSWYDRQETFWFFKTPAAGSDPDRTAQPPELENRRATSEELEQMKSAPVSVWKYRGQTKFTALSKEVGFNVHLPDIINSENPDKKLSIFTKNIEEYAFKGDLVRKMHVSYNTDQEGMDPAVMHEIILSPEPQDRSSEGNKDFLIDEETVNLGLPVQRKREWAMRIHALDEEPEIIRVTSWSWTDGSVYYSVSGDSSDEELYRDFIRQIIISRRKL